ncbi:MAG: anacyclamide/piricyclamide family prenylated cyclic peptide [Crocosphaera sp.]
MKTKKLMPRNVAPIQRENIGTISRSINTVAPSSSMVGPRGRIWTLNPNRKVTLGPPPVNPTSPPIVRPVSPIVRPVSPLKNCRCMCP